MRRLLPFLLAAVPLAAAAAPAAAAWTELPPYELPGGAVATCLRPAGDGQVTLLGALQRDSSPTDLLTLSDAGATVRSTTDLGWLTSCAEVAAAPGSPPLLAGVVALPRPRSESELPSGVRLPATVHVPAAVRAADAGLPPQALRDLRRGLIGRVSVATATSGAAVVAWSESPPRTTSRQWLESPERVYAAVRAPGSAAFGSARLVTRTAAARATPALGIDVSGHATVAWASERTGGRGSSATYVAALDPDGRVRMRRRLTTALGDALTVAVASDGRVFVATEAGTGIGVFERAPGATRFVRTRLASGALGVREMTLAVAPDGGAVLAYRAAPTAVIAHLRRPGGNFGRAQLIAGSARSLGYSSKIILTFTTTGPRPAAPNDDRGRELTAALGAGGAVLLTWTDPASRQRAAVARAARGTLARGIGGPVALGSPCRSADGARPVRLADGSLAAAWTDNARSVSGFLTDYGLGNGRLHIALPDSSAARNVPAAKTRLGLSARVVGPVPLTNRQPVRVRIRCSDGPCDARASLRSYAAERFDGRRFVQAIFDTVGTPVANGTGAVVRMQNIRGTTLASVRPPHRATISIVACTPGGAIAERLVLHPRVAHRPLRPTRPPAVARAHLRRLTDG